MYCVRAGICTVRMTVTILKDISTQTIVASDLPIPAIEPRFIISSNGGTNTGQFYVTNDCLVFNNAKANNIFYFTFGYPVI